VQDADDRGGDVCCGSVSACCGNKNLHDDLLMRISSMAVAVEQGQGYWS
jgi:hypothetical protein